jgi:RNA polymerase sigma-70 factor, ECF subfamily
VRDGTFDSEEVLISRLRSGDEAAFTTLVNGFQSRLTALARTFTRSPGLAEDIVQETWLAVIRGLAAFEGRSTLKTWIYSILVHRARTLAVRESLRVRRLTSYVENGHTGSPEWEPGTGRQGLWEERPVAWGLQDPAAVLRMRETLDVVERSLAELPDAQRQVVLLRDVEDIASADVCNILAISQTNQRVLLHRGRARIRQALDRHFRGVQMFARPHSGTRPRSDRRAYEDVSERRSHHREAAP